MNQTRAEAGLAAAAFAPLCAAVLLTAPFLAEPDDHAYQASIVAITHGHFLAPSGAQARTLAAESQGGHWGGGPTDILPAIAQRVRLPRGRWISEKNPGYPFLAAPFQALDVIRLAPLFYGALACTGLSCLNPIYQSSPCDPNPRFIAPYTADVTNINHWVAGGEFVWDNQGKGWNTSCSATACDWVQAHDTGSGNTINALADVGQTVYAGWCSDGCNPGLSVPFTSGIDTNFGGTWHTVSSTVLPNRIPTSFIVFPRNAAHVVATFGAFSRHWIPGGGVGHVFVSGNGGGTWKNVSGNLPDIPVEGSVVWRHLLVVTTDVGVFATSVSHPGSWQRLGRGVPTAPGAALTVAPGGGYLILATHGRGIWKLTHA